MPESAEVTLTHLYLDTKLKNKWIQNISIIGGRYKRNSAIPGLNIFKKVLPLKIVCLNSCGKFMWFELEDKDHENYYILNTFGLSGRWSFEKDKNSNVLFEILDDKTKKTYDLYFTDPRNFGTLQFTDKRKDLTDKLKKLAPDFLKTEFTEKEFYERYLTFLKKSKKRSEMPIIKILMGQQISNGLGSGLGNYLAPEILYRAKISPHRKLGDISKKEIYELLKQIKYVTKLCYLTNDTGYMVHLKEFADNRLDNVKKGIYPDYHPDIKIKKNEKFSYQVYQQKKDPLGNNVKAEIIIKSSKNKKAGKTDKETGRTTYWVPNVQT